MLKVFMWFVKQWQYIMFMSVIIIIAQDCILQSNVMLKVTKYSSKGQVPENCHSDIWSLIDLRIVSEFKNRLNYTSL